ncbi:DNA ligase D [Myxococcota bacterium]|nr:DNA ligase D [Myxococcota bacterium]
MPGSLDLYRKKRSADRTPEPFGSEKAEGTRVFVVHKHRATRLHWDLRLELGGVLRSWAVPKGPSFDPATKRMAVFVEDHPVEYIDFEGVIPEGNYGAGGMIVWDRGTWLPLEDPEQGLVKGKLLFELRGYKLRGVWTLVRTKQSDKDWLLIKKPDAYAAPEGTKPVGQESILSGLTVEELQAGKSRASDVVAELERLGAPKRPVRAADQQVMLAETSPVPFSRKGWLFELKYDGFRLLSALEDGEVAFHYRRGKNSTKTFPDLARAFARLPYRDLVVDGEVVVLDERGRPSFQRLQRRVQLLRPADIERAAALLPATLYAFDLLAFEGYDLRELPLVERKRLLKMALPKVGPIRYSDHVEEHGEPLFRQVEKQRLEGLVAKDARSPYRAGRSDAWRKIKVEHTGDFAVVGWTEPTGARNGFGAIHLALWDAGELRYVGRAGSGFSERQLAELSARLEAAPRSTPPKNGPVPTDRGHHWVEPAFVVEVSYRELTEDGLLRMPIFVRLRDDKTTAECVLDDSFHVRTATPARDADDDRGAPSAGGAAERDASDDDEGADGDEGAGDEDVAPSEGESSEDPNVEEEPPPELDPLPPPTPGAERKVPFTNQNKIFWPEEGYTKGDLCEYYRRISPWILPYLRDRLVVLTRYPDGIDGKSFFQKDAPPFVPGWVRTERMWSEHAQREIDYFVCDDVESLLFVINMGSIPLHVWSSRTTDLQHPDWCIIDLDPKKAPWAHVVALARALKTLADELELECFVKTSGSTGIHVLFPLGRQLTYEQSRAFGQLVSRVIEEENPTIATTKRVIGARGERVYLDYLQNGHGRLLVSPLCVRPVPHARVSTPLDWDEVNEDIRQEAFTIVTVPERFERMKRDPMIRVLSVKPNLARALDRLGKRVAKWK